jgi:3,4-dihydroxy 2-butanone 4-phosphate synthase/GTP cyclohydrolase II
MSISTTKEIVAELQAGRMVILVDEEDRENEGDLTLNEARCEQLALPMMTSRNGTSYGTNFTVSIEAAVGVTTGISAADRARTIQVAVAPGAVPADIVQPGHIFPLKAKKGGVLMRAGHTEAGCDFAELAGLEPAAVICEIMNDDGTMARLPDLVEFARLHELRIGTIADLIHYRNQNESIVERLSERLMNTAHGQFKAIVYRDKTSGGAHLALTHGDIGATRETLVRVHQPVSVLDMLETDATTHSWTVATALAAIRRADAGVMVLLNCESSAERMFSQFAETAAADAGARGAGSPPPAVNPARLDLRTYGIGAQILKDLGVGKMNLLSSPRKMPSMIGYDLEVLSFQAGPDCQRTAN